MDRAFTDSLRGGCRCRGQARQQRKSYFAFRDNGFKNLYGFFIRGAAGITDADIVVIGKDPGDLAVQIDTVNPVDVAGAQERQTFGLASSAIPAEE
jgi:hypothetical protein